MPLISTTASVQRATRQNDQRLGGRRAVYTLIGAGTRETPPISTSALKCTLPGSHLRARTRASAHALGDGAAPRGAAWGATRESRQSRWRPDDPFDGPSPKPSGARRRHSTRDRRIALAVRRSCARRPVSYTHLRA